MKNKITINYILCFLVFGGMAIATYNNIKGYALEPSVYEIMLEQINNPHMILFNLSFLILLLPSNNIINKKETSNIIPLKILQSHAFSILTFFILMFIANSILLFFIDGFNSMYVNKWTYVHVFTLLPYTPISSLIISILLLELRFVFCLYLVYLINIFTNSSYWGIWSMLMVNFIDFRFYYQSNKISAFNILPIEHTKIIYSEFLINADNTINRPSYFVSVIYWLILICIIYFLLKCRCIKQEE